MTLHHLLVTCVAALAISAPTFAYGAPEIAPSSPQQTAARTAQEEKPGSRYTTMLRTHDFDGLAAAEKTIIDDYRNGRINTDEFSERISALVEPFSADLIPDAMRWVEAQPRSYAARLGLGLLYRDAATEARGQKWAHETSREQFKKMTTLSRQALNALQASLPLFEKPYPSYVTIIKIAASLGEDEKKKRYLDKAIEIDPAATGAYASYIHYSTPRWGVSYDELEPVLEKMRQGPMSSQGKAYLDALVLSWKANDEWVLHKNPLGAVSFYIQAYERDPRRAQVQFLYSAGRAANDAKQPQTAIDIYTRIIDAYPDEADAYYSRGSAHHALKAYEPALKDFIAAARLGNKYAQNDAGYYYMIGRGGVKDLKLAEIYLSQAAAQGNERAMVNLRELKKIIK